MLRNAPGTLDQDRHFGRRDVVEGLEINSLRLKWINEIRPFQMMERPHFLDIGCSFGHFLRLVNYARKDALLHGIDAESDCIHVCRDALPVADLHVQRCDCQFPFADNAMDVITCFHVIEHLSSSEELNSM